MSQVKILKLKRENNMTDNVIIKYLESLLDTMRLYESSQASIGKGFVEDIISMYDRQKAKIAVLSVENANLKISIEDLKADNSFLTEAVASADAPSPIVSRLIQENNEKHMNIVNDLKAEIERLKHRKTELQIRNQELQHEKSEAIKEFAERLKAMHKHNKTSVVSLVTVFDNINNLVKEMVGDAK